MIYVNESYAEKSLSNDEMVEIAKEAGLNLLEMCASVERKEVVTEGANIEITKGFRAGKKKYKAAISAAKKSIASKNYADAKKYNNEAKAALDDIEKCFKANKSSIGSALLGYMFFGLVDFGEVLIPTVALIGGVSASIAGDLSGNKIVMGAGIATAAVSEVLFVVKAINIFVRDIKITVDELKDFDTSTADSLNLYRTTFIRKLEDLKKNVDMVNKLIDKKEKENS